MAGKKNTKPKKEKGAAGLNLRGFKGSGRSKMPTKTSINLAIKDESGIKPQIAVPAVIIICILAALFGKFLVADRMIAASTQARQVAEMRSNLDAIYGKIADYEDVADVYAHYTYSGMTDEELERVDRVDVMNLIEKALDAGYTLKNWSVSNNIMSLKMTGKTLQELNNLSKILENEPIVDQCVMTTADKSEKEENKDVSATFTVYLHQPGEETEEP